MKRPGVAYVLAWGREAMRRRLSGIGCRAGYLRSVARVERGGELAVEQMVAVSGDAVCGDGDADAGARWKGGRKSGKQRVAGFCEQR